MEALDVIFREWCHSTTPIESRTAPFFEHFHWNRIILDEAHEEVTPKIKHVRSGPKKAKSTVKLNCYSYKLDFELIMRLRSRFRWYVSGTPFAKDLATLRGCLRFLNFTLNGERVFDEERTTHDVLAGPYRHIILRTIQRFLFCRNTKESIGSDNTVPPYTELVHFLEFTEIERGLYMDASDRLQRRQLCCHPQISDVDSARFGDDEKTLNEVKDMLIQEKQKLMTILEAKMDGHDRKVEICEEEHNMMRRDPEYRDKPAALESRRIRALEKLNTDFNQSLEEFKRAQKTVRFLQNMSEEEHKDSECLVCLDQYKEPVITQCGHVFCRACLVAAVRVNPICPHCRSVFPPDNYYERVHLGLNKDEKKNVKPSDQKMESQHNCPIPTKRDIARYGTKTSYLITMIKWILKESPSHRIILFSQWNRMLKRIGTTLRRAQIPLVFCEGPVASRNKAITEFQSGKDGIRIIMLSLERSASGTNLTEASHIIMMEPMEEVSAEAAYALEQQAIGRAHRQGQTKEIQVIRLIIRNTLEEELYQRNSKLKSAQSKQNDEKGSRTSPMEISDMEEKGGISEKEKKEGKKSSASASNASASNASASSTSSSSASVSSASASSASSSSASASSASASAPLAIDPNAASSDKVALEIAAIASAQMLDREKLRRQKIKSWIEAAISSQVPPRDFEWSMPAVNYLSEERSRIVLSQKTLLNRILGGNSWMDNTTCYQVTKERVVYYGNINSSLEFVNIWDVPYNADPVKVASIEHAFSDDDDDDDDDSD
jgi:SNF2 family DNA or RNA helicase